MERRAVAGRHRRSEERKWHESHGLQRSKPAKAPCQWAQQVGKDLRSQRIN
ncbi:hypothetical protein [Olivibacter domesticus]|uniref:hypothetical protein n=1 Tax=Olivibacter domesticus TaxID=407022 RepID=UPI00138FC7BE|nr:hypothetical protein [Olivibacter domesticus]